MAAVLFFIKLMGGRIPSITASCLQDYTDIQRQYKQSQSTDGHAGNLRLFGAYKNEKLSSLGFFVGRGTVDARYWNIEKPKV